MWMSFYSIFRRSENNSHFKYTYTTTNCLLKTYIDNVSVVLEIENKIVDTVKGFVIPVGLPWHLPYEVYIPVNCNWEFHWVLVVVVLKEESIKVYDPMSSYRTYKKLSVEMQKLSTMLSIYLQSSGIFKRKTPNNMSPIPSHKYYDIYQESNSI